MFVEKRTPSSFKFSQIAGVSLVFTCFASLALPVLRQVDASVDHAQKLATGVSMYASDYDDHLPLATTWNTGHDQLTITPGASFSTWGWNVLPYVNSPDYFQDPNVTANSTQTSPPDKWNTFHTHYGYNYIFLSPFVSDSSNHQRVNSVVRSTATSPQNTVLVASKWAFSMVAPGIQSQWNSGVPNGMLMDVGLEVPDCSHLTQMCFSNWGVNSFFDPQPGTAGLLLTEGEGRYSGGVASRDEGKVVVAWLDGHVNTKTPLDLAAGTNWNSGMEASAVVVNSPSQYLWSLTK